MQWKALDMLLERVEQLEREVYLLKPLEQEDNDIPEIYITENGTSFILKDGNTIQKVSAPSNTVNTTNPDVFQYSLDGIKRTIDHLKITDPKILWTTGTNLILLDKEVFLCLKGLREPPDSLKTKANFLKEEINKYGFYLVLNTNILLEKKLSSLP